MSFQQDTLDMQDTIESLDISSASNLMDMVSDECIEVISGCDIVRMGEYYGIVDKNHEKIVPCKYNQYDSLFNMLSIGEMRNVKSVSMVCRLKSMRILCNKMASSIILHLINFTNGIFYDAITGVKLESLHGSINFECGYGSATLIIPILDSEDNIKTAYYTVYSDGRNYELKYY